MIVDLLLFGPKRGRVQETNERGFMHIVGLSHSIPKTGCSKRSFGKAAASEIPRRTFYRTLQALSDART